ncbi:MAG: hypothetical protein NTY19_14630 [Planctomycetota bacterium]|nr:hypothetical protein [Planctomycetota bacterium]
MKTIDPAKYVTMTIDESGRRRFEAFLDRNYPGWREREIFRERNAGTITRQWPVGQDDMERTAFYRIDYVEISDDFIDLDSNDEGQIHLGKHLICDIDGDLTPVARWAER